MVQFLKNLVINALDNMKVSFIQSVIVESYLNNAPS
ncbi:hypothetical protein ALQ33_04749 [Pseudomonas syringae pv. philadelphi]|uniref:Uncharacterized protein n=1 Tax=Pseudomonas syringae pv. philadelphi TaxID=251706 RepID=A0A3M3ZNW3_9PSED|nr:hypothetical protein ALQ33_04749 [Pseudomonas syringae pv. philadelphi]